MKHEVSVVSFVLCFSYSNLGMLVFHDKVGRVSAYFKQEDNSGQDLVTSVMKDTYIVVAVFCNLLLLSVCTC